MVHSPGSVLATLLFEEVDVCLAGVDTPELDVDSPELEDSVSANSVGSSGSMASSTTLSSFAGVDSIYQKLFVLFLSIFLCNFIYIF